MLTVKRPTKTLKDKKVAITLVPSMAQKAKLHGTMRSKAETSIRRMTLIRMRRGNTGMMKAGSKIAKASPGATTPGKVMAGRTNNGRVQSWLQSESTHGGYQGGCSLISF